MNFYDGITDFIFAADEPQKSDIIFIPGGNYPESAEYAAQLYHAGYAPLLLPSGKYSITAGHFVEPQEPDWKPGRTEGGIACGAAEAGGEAKRPGSETEKSTVCGAAEAGGEAKRAGSETEKSLACGAAEAGREARRPGSETGSGNTSAAAPVGAKAGKDGYRTECDYLCAILSRCGVPQEAVLREDEATFTWENAIFSRRKLEESGIRVKKAIICCQAFHARRCLMYYQEQFPETEFQVCPVVTRGIARDTWYKSRAGIDTVLGEVERCGVQFGEILAQHAGIS